MSDHPPVRKIPVRWAESAEQRADRIADTEFFDAIWPDVDAALAEIDARILHALNPPPPSTTTPTPEDA